jgi:hypothetical protein
VKNGGPFPPGLSTHNGSRRSLLQTGDRYVQKI